jgi:hypothetical protein
MFILTKLPSPQFNCKFFDKDITKDIIAMGMPSDKVFERVARNPLSDVAKFLKEKHGNSFKVYNL